MAMASSSMMIRMAKPLLSSSCLLGCTMFAGDILSQSISSYSPTMYFQTTDLMSRDFKRSFTVGVTGFAVSGPLSFSIGRLVHKLYPGCGRLTVIKRTVMSTCLSPIVIACGVVPSVYLLTHNRESVHVGCFAAAS